MEKVIEIKDIGRVTLRKYKQSKRIRIKLAVNEVLVTMPFVVKFEEALGFVEQKRDWIIRNKEALNQRKQYFNFDTDFSTKSRKLEITKRSDSNKIVSHIAKKKILILMPESIDIYHDEVQQIIRNIIEKAFRTEAYEYLPSRLHYLAKEHGFRYKSLRITSAKTRWGSCNAQNRINLSLYNMQLPDHLIDYIILHELAHTEYKNHGTGFHRFLNEICEGKSEMYNRELKNYQPGVYRL